ncbi:MAG TPA: cbb3-type cytochrome c oxidase N-terminal domain-containing protein [Bacteroidia bacterium]|nr:cbb3-type cytochrome c oxidase N-terminal domain-containing protein [Bacteroidia bacterium]
MNLINSKIAKYFMSLTLLMAGFSSAFATSVAPVAKSNNLMNNALFWVLFAVIIILLFFITSVSRVIKNITETDLKKSKSETKINSTVVGLLLFLGSMLTAGVLQAQEVAASTVKDGFFQSEYGGLSAGTFYVMVAAIITELFVLFVLLIILRKMLRILGMVSDLAPEDEKPLFDLEKISTSLNDSIPLEREAEFMTDHEYDGIRELDNNLPPWWKYGFYLTIVIGIIYLFNYHITRTYPLQSAEYQKELADAAIAKEAYLKTVADKVDESNVTLLTAASELSAGQTIFKANCVACHGQEGEGTVGPNLTDEYWIHGGGVKNIFKTIKYGVPAKGMIAWQAQLKPNEMQQVASYIMSLKGTNPPGAKAPQGDLYKDEGVISDSTKTDSTAVNVAVKDSLVTATIK